MEPSDLSLLATLDALLQEGSCGRMRSNSSGTCGWMETRATDGGVLRDGEDRRRAVPRRGHPPLRPAEQRELLAKGKTVTGFANVEEDFADNAVWSMNLLPKGKHLMPWRIEDELKRLGAN